MIWRYIDTHCHIEQEEYADDREEVIDNALREKIALITSAISSKSWDAALAISQRYSNVFLSIGMDPTNYSEYQQAIQYIKENMSNLVAVGEVGLDHYRIRDHAQRDEQEKAFREFISLSKENRLPLQVHSRSAGKKALDILEDMEGVDVHMHAFDGRSSYARKASRDLGYYFSIPTSVVRSRQKQKMVKAINIERLLLETDSPVLGPEKGMRNIPSNITIALHEVSKILRRDEEELREIILENTLRLYHRIM